MTDVFFHANLSNPFVTVLVLRNAYTGNPFVKHSMRYTNFLPAICLLLIFCACDAPRMVETKEGNKTERYTVDDQGRRHGEYRKYFGDDLLVEECAYQNGLLHGTRKIYGKTGNLEITETYVNDILHGPYKVYHDNGNINTEGDYTQGVMSGVWKRYYPDNTLLEEVTYADNEENGPFTEYHPNGNLKAKGTYLRGDFEQDSLYLYNESGALVKKMFCNKGICNTIWRDESYADED